MKDLNNTNRFITVYEENRVRGEYLSDRLIFVDKITKVQYLYVMSSLGYTQSVLVDSEGKPLLYEGEL